jgi:hypothetical protein
MSLAKRVIYAILRRLAMAAISGILASAIATAPEIVRKQIEIDSHTALLWAIMWLVFEAAQKAIREYRR